LKKIFGFAAGPLLCLLLALSITPALASEPSDASPCLWSNAVSELGQVAVSPVSGSWEGYALAAGFGAAFGVGLNNDLPWYRAVQAQRSPWQNSTMPVITLLGDGWFNIGVYAAMHKFGGERERRTAAMAVEGQISVAVVATLAKFIFTSPRPGADPDQRRWFTLNAGDNSFPSGHAMTAFCAAAILGDAYHMEWLTFPLAGLVAYSRVYTRNHWPADVIAGAGLGLLIGETVVAFHPGREDQPSIKFSAEPTSDGAQARITWYY
jgi:membrane-associated phospholipid phosphatase